MFNHPFSRCEIANAHMVYFRHRGGERPSRAVAEFSEFAYQKYGEKEWDDLDLLADFGDGDLACYFALVAETEGVGAAAALALEWGRVTAVNGVTIRVQTSGVDPTLINLVIEDEIADAWCTRHGSLDGGTWERVDGPSFCYDTAMWRPGLIREWRAEGFKLDLSQYEEPSDRDLAVARHASECDACDYDWHKADKHYVAPAPPV